jgi:hypothetical protein
MLPGWPCVSSCWCRAARHHARLSRPAPARCAQALSLASSSKLLTLFELFASPRFLFARPGNVAFAAQLLEALNNLVQYQYESNAVLGERGARV